MKSGAADDGLAFECGEVTAGGQFVAGEVGGLAGQAGADPVAEIGNFTDRCAMNC